MLLSLVLPALAAGPVDRGASPERLTEQAQAREVFETLTTASHGSMALVEPPPPGAGSGARNLDLYVAGDIALVVDDDGEWLAQATTHILSGDLNWILNSISARFYDHCGDEYQYLQVMLVYDLGFFGAFYAPLANDVRGIGYDSVVASEEFDTSNNQLDGFIFMNAAELWADNPEGGRYVFGQEFGHRWGAFVNVAQEGLDPDALLGRDLAHWSYWLDTTNSPMEGNTWLDNGDGTFTVDVEGTSTYSDLDLYLMGFVGPEAVAPQTLLLVDPEEQARVERDPAYTPEGFAETWARQGQAITVTGTPVEVPLDSIIAAEGARVPAAADSPRTFRMATVVLVLSTDTVDDQVIAMLDTVRSTFEADWEADVQGLADLDTTLGDCDAPVWGAPVDTGGETGGEDSGSVDTADTGPTDTGDGGGEKLQGGCGCASTSSPGPSFATGLLALALLARRRHV